MIPPVTRDCSNDCGPGLDTCVDEKWQGCKVDPVTRDCSSVCGSGSQTCTDGVWAACDAPRPLPPILTTTVRDFHAHNPPDFELDVSAARMATGSPAGPRPRHRPVGAGRRRHAGLRRQSHDADDHRRRQLQRVVPRRARRESEDDDRLAADGQRDRARLLRLRQPVLLPDRQSAIRQRGRTRTTITSRSRPTPSSCTTAARSSRSAATTTAGSSSTGRW